MVKRTFGSVLQVVGGIGAGLAIALLVVVWRLSAGPISLAFLSPYMADALSAAVPGYRVTLDDTILTWAVRERSLDIRLLNVRAVASGDAVVAGVPELGLSLSAEALMRGRIVPRSIELLRPEVRLIRRADGNFEVGFGEAAATSGAVLAGGLADLLTTPRKDFPLSHLGRVSIVDADLTIEDRRLDVVWHAPATQVRLRRSAAGIEGEIFLDVRFGAARPMVAAVFEYRASDGKLDLGIGFDQVNPAHFSRLLPALAALQGADLALNGTAAAVGMSVDGGVGMVGFEARGGRGRLALPAPLAAAIQVVGVEARGRFDGDSGVVEVDRLFVDLGADGRLPLPAPADHAMPLRSLSAEGRFVQADGRIEVAALDLDLHGPRARLSAVIDGVGGAMVVDAKGTLDDLPVDAIGRYWPRAWGTDARDWVVAHLADGMVRRVRAALVLGAGADGGFAVESLSGDMEADGVTVDYLAPMPKARAVAATMRFDMRRFDITLSGGQAAGLSARSGTVRISGLDEDDLYVDIELVIDGAVSDALRFVGHQPLGFTAAPGLDPAKTGGTAAARLKLRFILERALTTDGVEIVASAEM